MNIKEQDEFKLVQDEMKEPTLITMEEAELSTKQALSANNAKWREKICGEETTFKMAAIILRYAKQLECGKHVIPLEEDCYDGDTEVQIAKEITNLLSQMEGE